ncbi:MAG: STAS domain-containing protein [Acetobacteraceae bacterium]|nr:STAS domain-containing protein [Acetobacteraceae bacterium]
MTNAEADETGTLHLEGALTLRTADEIKMKLLEASARYGTVEVECNEADEVDLSIIQLLLAAQLSAHAMNRTIRFAHPVSGAMRDSLERGGFLSGPTAQNHAFWLNTEIC